MSTHPAEAAANVEHRRWLTGLGVSVSFGLFGAVMAWLSYSARTRPLAPAAAQVSAPSNGGAEPAKHRHRSPRDRD